MKNLKQKKLLDYLNELKEKNIKIRVFKEIFDPLDLALQLESLEHCGLIDIDWKNGLIINNSNVENSFLNKNKIKRKISEKPGYMIGEEIDINEPYV